MTLPIIAFTSLLAGSAAAALFWFGADLVYKLRYTMAQRKRAKKQAAKEAEQAEAKGKEKEK